MNAGRLGGAAALVCGAGLCALALTGCAASAPGAPTLTASTPVTSATSPASSPPSPVTEIAFADLIADPEAHLGEPVRLVGTVHFLSECPPPGATPSACVLMGYVASPDQRSFGASDAARAVPLAEGGRRVSCNEGEATGGSAVACGDWIAGTAYELDGALERQVLGGRETDAVQFDVVEKTVDSPAG
ncbi:hypothetical protein MUN74_06740 [Agromyces endophyticus]|uniref:hypothetical protein n=1 Tax=Agromyces sp. H17E-10 TaxID=2932244 RepID=UPI001FD03090|nr:hypothetical protein [Agromyces sp. H17E-10]UOQ90602.1 hypothetical protein MUN74_06740 [Agromyces sp. H17E-10]